MLVGLEPISIDSFCYDNCIGFVQSIAHDLIDFDSFD